MPKKLIANRSLIAKTLFLLLLASSLVAAANAASLFTQTTPQTKAKPSDQSVAVNAALKMSFGSAVEAVKGFKPYYLTGDFNGDGAQDMVVVVRIKGRSTDLPVDVKVYNPFERPKAVFPDNPAANPTLAFAIIHGGKTGWQTSPAVEKFLLFGQTPILILQYQRATSGRPDEAKKLMELLGKGSKRLRALGWPPAAAKGDSIVLGTEATDSLLYWNGRNYRWEEASGAE